MAMAGNNGEVETALRSTMSQEELELEVEQKIKSFHGLLTRQVALRLLAKEKGLLREEERNYSLGEIPKGAKKFGFSASVKKIWPAVTYASGKRSRVIEVDDGSASMPLVLWNGDVELADQLRSRDRIAVKGAYEKSGEIHLGYSGKLEVVGKAEFSELGALAEGEEAHVRGFVSKIEGIDTFIRYGRQTRAFSFMISDGKNERRCVIYESIERGERLREGDEVMIEDARIGKDNIEIGKASRMLSRRKKEMLMGTMEAMECEGSTASDERLLAVLAESQGQERKITLDQENALKLLGVEVAGDIHLATVVGLKKEKLLNSPIAVRITEKEGRIVIVR